MTPSIQDVVITFIEEKVSSKYLNLASGANFGAAHYTLGFMYLDGIGVTEDHNEAQRFFDLFGADGNRDEKFQVGLAYYFKLDNPQKEFEWFSSAAELGHPIAQTIIGNMYNDGIIVPKDLELALKWLKLAVENEDELVYPPSVYASTKYFGEILAKNILERSSTQIQIPRFFTVYGPFGRPDMSILRFIHWIQTEKEVIIYGDGNQRRSFTYVEDIVDGIIKLINYDHSGTFNFGSNETWSLNDVISFIEDSTGKKAKIKFEERAYKDVDVVLPSLDLSNDILEWEPSTNIKTGIDKTVEWYLSHEEDMKNIKFKYDYEK